MGLNQWENSAIFCINQSQNNSLGLFLYTEKEMQSFVFQLFPLKPPLSFFTVLISISLVVCPSLLVPNGYSPYSLVGRLYSLLAPYSELPSAIFLNFLKSSLYWWVS